MNTNKKHHIAQSSVQYTRADYIGLDMASQRPGPGGTLLNYIEAYEVINIMNAKFGSTGWTTEILQMLPIQPSDSKIKEYTATVRIKILENGQSHDGIGYGSGVEREKAMKEAESDAFKRAARYFGNEFGNCLYDKEYVRVAPKTTTTTTFDE